MTGAARGLPPGPRAPAAWQTVEWIVRPTAFLRRCAARHGVPFTIRTFWAEAPMVLVSHPDDVRRVFTAPELGGGGSAVLEPFAGPSSILVLDGEEHLRQRRLMLPAFHGERMRAYRPLVRELAEREVRGWRGEVRTHERMQALTLEIILRVVMGSDSRALRAAIEHALGLARSAPRLVAMALVQRDAGPYRTFMRAVARVDELLYALIEQPSPPDSVLALLKAARDADGAPPTQRELRDQLVTLLAAGHETTAGALAWAFERLARHPHAVARLDEDGYRDAVVKEVLRIRPVLSVAPREVREPFQLGGRTLPPGVQVAPSIYLAHRRPEAFGPDPLAFRPERWLDDPPPPSYAWLPFGGGDRRCAGAAFAQMEMGEVLRAAAEHRLLAAPRGERVLRRGVSLTPARGGTVTVSR